MERIKRFFLDDSASAELVSSLVLVGSVLIVGAAALGLYYGSIQNFFTGAKGTIDTTTSQIPGSIPFK